MLSPLEHEPDVEADLGQSFWAALLLTYGLVVLFSLSRVPIPGVNEPHYLCKAKHLWQPEWCSKDLFLTSSNPHLIFYICFGWLTQFFSLDTTASISRLVGFMPLAVGWQFLATRLTGKACCGALGLSLFFVLQSAGNWSGEWLVGGIESKVIAYGFLFWAIAQAMECRLPSSAFLAGLAVSFHPVVGVWGCLATALGTLAFIGLKRPSFRDPALPTLGQWGWAILLFSLAATPGIVTAGQAVFEGDSEQTRIASLLQVGHRLAHHLDPLKFPKEAYRYMAALILGWLVLSPGTLSKDRGTWWLLIVAASLLIALTGIAIGWGPRPLKELPGYEWRITALKFYPFRLADLLVPVALSFVAANRVVIAAQRFVPHNSLRGFLIVVLCGVLTLAGIGIPGPDRNPSRMSPAKRKNWIAACQWVEQNSAETELVYSFDNQWGVKWFANRAEYVNYKDCPQDPASIIEWNQRRWLISRWKNKAFADGRVSTEELENLAKQTKVSIFICDRMGPIDQEPDYRNQDFRVYRMEVVAKNLGSPGSVE